LETTTRRKALCDHLTALDGTNHVKEAGDRALTFTEHSESWGDDPGEPLILEHLPENEQGYIQGLNLFLDATSGWQRYRHPV